ncbi:MAG TPA: hypothetical protein VKE22_26450 [Haliangiales bacterium]|nr:hypothetical protein [Haliangiales bacterium]
MTAAFQADVAGLAGFCARAGLVHKVNRALGVVAVFHRVLDRDAPIFVGAAGWQLAFEIRLPFYVPAGRRPAVAERLAGLPRGARGAWELRAGTVVYRTALPATTGVTDEAATAALDDVRAHAAAAAKELEALARA